MEDVETCEAGSRTSKTVRFLANLFLLLFLADGIVSSIDEVVSLFSATPALAGLRVLMANLAILMSLVIYISLAIDQRLPKRVFLPLVFFVWLCPMVPGLFPSLSAYSAVGVIAAVAQVLLFLAVTSEWRKRSNGSFMVPQSTLHGPFFSWKNSAKFLAASVVILPCLLALMMFSAVNGYLQQYTGGFMHVAPDGLHMSEKVYRKGDKVVRLISMIHVGEKQYYDKVLQQRYPGRTIVLAEGVTDDKGLLRSRLDYGKFAGYLGLSTQKDQMLLKGRPVKASELEETGLQEPGNGQPDILRADVDISTFHPSTVRFLDELGRQMDKGDSLRDQLRGTVMWWEKNSTPQMEDVLLDDILHRRNIELISHFRNALRHYDVIIIPWGAMHMPEIEAEVRGQGFRLQQVQDRVSVHFRK